MKIGAAVALYFGSVELGKRRLREHCIKLGDFEVPFCPKGGKRRVRKYCYRLVAVLRDKPSKDSSSHIWHSCVPRKWKCNLSAALASIQKIAVIETCKIFC